MEKNRATSREKETRGTYGETGRRFHFLSICIYERGPRKVENCRRCTRDISILCRGDTASIEKRKWWISGEAKFFGFSKREKRKGGEERENRVCGGGKKEGGTDPLLC